MTKIEPRRPNLVLGRSARAFASAALLAACGRYGADADATDPMSPAIDRFENGAAPATAGSSESAAGREPSGASTPDAPATSSSGAATEGAPPNVSRAPVTEGETTPEPADEGEPGTEGEATPNAPGGEAPPGDGPVAPPDPPVVIRQGPCDLFEAVNTPCVGAWSTTRALYGAYRGPLYQVRRSSDRTTRDIPQLPDGIADSSVQDAFCPGNCTISRLYDQSPLRNDLAVSGPVWHMPNGGVESNAKLLRTTLAGRAVYGLVFEPHAPDLGDPGNSYRNHGPTGTATGDQAETIYEVVDTRIYNGLCCNSFGNAETTGNPDGPKTMEAIYFGNAPFFGNGAGNGPWLLADLEAGTFPSSQQWDDRIPSLNIPAYATLMLKGFSGDRFALKHGDARGGRLTTQWDGPRPTIVFEGQTVHYSPMEKQGAIVLGSGGDGSTWSSGSFFEGAMTIGVVDNDLLDQAIQANVVAAGYGR